MAADGERHGTKYLNIIESRFAGKIFAHNISSVISQHAIIVTFQVLARNVRPRIIINKHFGFFCSAAPEERPAAFTAEVQQVPPATEHPSG
jgi:hypothetical protein